VDATAAAALQRFAITTLAVEWKEPYSLVQLKTIDANIVGIGPPYISYGIHQPLLKVLSIQRDSVESRFGIFCEIRS
jgi:hypothetical protein